MTPPTMPDNDPVEIAARHLYEMWCLCDGDGPDWMVWDADGDLNGVGMKPLSWREDARAVIAALEKAGAKIVWREPSEDRIDYEGDNLDDVAINGVSMFRLEYMDRNRVWIRLYRDGHDKDVVIWLSAKGKITGRHDEEANETKKAAPKDGPS